MFSVGANQQLQNGRFDLFVTPYWLKGSQDNKFCIITWTDCFNVAGRRKKK